MKCIRARYIVGAQYILVINIISLFSLRLKVVWNGVDEIWLENNLLDLNNSDMQGFEQ